MTQEQIQQGNALIRRIFQLEQSITDETKFDLIIYPKQGKVDAGTDSIWEDIEKFKARIRDQWIVIAEKEIIETQKKLEAL